jgi:NAD-dependent SIR2 family protein deacetylase
MLKYCRINFFLKIFKTTIIAKDTTIYKNTISPFPKRSLMSNFTVTIHSPFVRLAKEIWPGMIHSPTLTHSFISLLAHKKKLLRVYTQNIDGLEVLAGLPSDKIVECHGHFRTASCIDCHKAVDNMDNVVERITQHGKVPICQYCHTGHVKPDIVFFGEGLPHRFHTLLKPDLARADLLIILGTSLMVAPVVRWIVIAKDVVKEDIFPTESRLGKSSNVPLLSFFCVKPEHDSRYGQSTDLSPCLAQSGACGTFGYCWQTKQSH